jgi:hypothetical protein
MTKYFEVTVALIVGQLKNGKDKIQKESYLVSALTVTEAEGRVLKDFQAAGVTLDYKVVGVRESKIIRVIE